MQGRFGGKMAIVALIKLHTDSVILEKSCLSLKYGLATETKIVSKPPNLKIEIHNFD